MTVREIHEAVIPYKKVSRAQLYNYFEDLKISPIGARQKPQRYPENTAIRIIVHLGYVPPVPERFAADVKNGVNGHAKRIPTMPELRAARKKARAGK